MFTDTHLSGMNRVCADIVFDNDSVEALSTLEIVRKNFPSSWQEKFNKLEQLIGTPMAAIYAVELRHEVKLLT